MKILHAKSVQQVAHHWHTKIVVNKANVLKTTCQFYKETF